jgi:hypothetical protein
MLHVAIVSKPVRILLKIDLNIFNVLIESTPVMLKICVNRYDKCMNWEEWKKHSIATPNTGVVLEIYVE